MQFFIDLHSFFSLTVPSRSANPPPHPSAIALISGASPCAFDDERHNIHHPSSQNWRGGVGGGGGNLKKIKQVENRTLTHTKNWNLPGEFCSLAFPEM